MSEDKDIDKQKQVVFYAACVNAWSNTRMEGDKSIMTLSAGGVGLLVTLISTIGVSDIWMIIWYLLGLVSFLVSIICVLFVFRLNAEYLEGVVDGSEKDSKVLDYLDRTVSFSFVIGIVFSLIIGLSVAINSYNNKNGGFMAKEHAKKPVVIGDSLSQMRKLDSSTKLNESYNGMAAMKPKPADNQSAPKKGNTDSSSLSSKELKDKK